MRIRPNGRLAQAGLLLFSFALLFASLIGFGLLMECHYPVSGSLPFGLYRTIDGKVTRGGLVSLCLPEDVAAIGLEAGIISRRWWKACALGARPMMKIVAAVGGDLVLLEETRLTVNGRVFATWPERVPTPGGGSPRCPVQLEVPEGWVWIHSEHPRSWDSRHYGPIPLDERAVPVAPYILLSTRNHRPGSPL